MHYALSDCLLVHPLWSPGEVLLVVPHVLASLLHGNLGIEPSAWQHPHHRLPFWLLVSRGWPSWGFSAFWILLDGLSYRVILTISTCQFYEIAELYYFVIFMHSDASWDISQGGSGCGRDAFCLPLDAIRLHFESRQWTNMLKTAPVQRPLEISSLHLVLWFPRSWSARLRNSLIKCRLLSCCLILCNNIPLNFQKPTAKFTQSNPLTKCATYTFFACLVNKNCDNSATALQNP